MPNASERGFARRPVRFLHHDIVLTQFRPLDHQPEYTRRQSSFQREPFDNGVCGECSRPKRRSGMREPVVWCSVEVVAGDRELSQQR